ncbi:MAG: (Fe-S)-binding protein [Desulfuromonas sp.]|nr:(Fe-S)-binding protein [Desulfuromonas sp.]
MFKRYGTGLEVQSVYQQLDQLKLPQRPTTQGLVTIHDPCVSRFASEDHDAVRSLIDKSGLERLEMTNCKQTTLCCGEGGCVIAEDAELAQSWRHKRAEQTDGKWLVSYCAACVDFLRPISHTSHVLDLLFDPLAAVDRSSKPPGSLKRYWNRWRLKKKVQHQLNTPISGDRSMTTATVTSKKKGGQLLVVALLIGAISALKFSGVADQLQPEQLRDAIAATGMWAPVIFMLL